MLQGCVACQVLTTYQGCKFDSGRNAVVNSAGCEQEDDSGLNDVGTQEELNSERLRVGRRLYSSLLGRVISFFDFLHFECTIDLLTVHFL